MGTIFFGGGRWGPAPLEWGVCLLETRCYPTCVFVPVFVAVGQTVSAQVGPKNRRASGQPRAIGVQLIP